MKGVPCTEWLVRENESVSMAIVHNLPCGTSCPLVWAIDLSLVDKSVACYDEGSRRLSFLPSIGIVLLVNNPPFSGGNCSLSLALLFHPKFIPLQPFQTREKSRL